MISSLLAGCALHRGNHFLEIASPELPPVEWSLPDDPQAVICLDEENMGQLLERNLRISGYIGQLRAALQECR